MAERAMLLQKVVPGTACPKCGGGLEDGFLRDATYGGFKVGCWVEGTPQRSFWTGTQVAFKRKYRVGAYRCIDCGHLEFYAREPEA